MLGLGLAVEIKPVEVAEEEAMGKTESSTRLEVLEHLQKQKVLSGILLAKGPRYEMVYSHMGPSCSSQHRQRQR